MRPSSSARAAGARRKIDAVVAAVTAAGPERDDFDAIVAREIKQLQWSSRVMALTGDRR